MDSWGVDSGAWLGCVAWDGCANGAGAGTEVDGCRGGSLVGATPASEWFAGMVVDSRMVRVQGPRWMAGEGGAPCGSYSDVGVRAKKIITNLFDGVFEKACFSRGIRIFSGLTGLS